MSTSTKAAVVVFFAWLILVFINLQIRGAGISAPGMSPLGFWGLMSFIALLLGLLAKVITGLFVMLAKMPKKTK